MRILLVLVVVVFSAFGARAQSGEIGRWEVATAIAYGSENNIGNPGLMLINEYSYTFSKAFSASVKLGAFHSLPLFHPPDFYFSFSGLSAGGYLNYSKRFNSERNFVRLSAGPSYFHSNSLAIDMTATAESYSSLGYGLALEGGGIVGEKLSLGLLLNIYSYDIFGDIIVIGCNAHFRL